MANKTKIEWCDYTINPVKGLCPVGCSYCYARAMYHRYKWDTRIEFQYAKFRKELEPFRKRKPARIFVGSTIDLFHDNTVEYMPLITEAVAMYPQHTFIFLTKCPENLPREWPDNCWVGVSASNAQMFIDAGRALETISAKVKFISAEPLLSWDSAKPGFIATMLQRWGINWVIIGQQTPVRASTMPKVEWIKEIVAAADAACTPVFLKDNLRNFYPAYLRQEFPALEAVHG